MGNSVKNKTVCGVMTHPAKGDDFLCVHARSFLEHDECAQWHLALAQVLVNRVVDNGGLSHGRVHEKCGLHHDGANNVLQSKDDDGPWNDTGP
jgi:hypothetical protein